MLIEAVLLVLYKISRFIELTNIMIIAAYSAKEAVSTQLSRLQLQITYRSASYD